jgi:general secretion pathway protein G
MFGSEQRKVHRSGRWGALTARCHLPAACSRNARGFTLLELMIVISILVILAMIGMATYNRTVLAAKEATLREDLFTMRKMIDQYGADKGKLPQSLDDLRSAGYIHDIPIDPMTDAADWQVEFGEDPGSTGGEQGVTNVRSASGDLSSDGSSRYSEW